MRATARSRVAVAAPRNRRRPAAILGVVLLAGAVATHGGEAALVPPAAVSRHAVGEVVAPAAASAAAAAVVPAAAEAGPAAPASTSLPLAVPADVATPPPPTLPTLLVTVSDAAGAAIAGAAVTAIDGEHDLAQTRTDPSGRAAVPAATHTVRATAAGYWPRTQAITAGHTTLTLATAPRLRGRVFDATGHPAAGADIAVLAVVADRASAPPLLPPQAPRTTTLDDGSFVIAWPAPAPHDVVVRAHGAGPLVLAALPPAACDGAPLLLTLPAPACVRGELAPTGDPGGTRIELWRHAPPSRLGSDLGPARPWRHGQLLAATTAAPDGTFVLQDLPAGPAYVVAPNTNAAKFVTLTAGATTYAELPGAATTQLCGAVAGASTHDEAHVFVYGGEGRLWTAPVGAGHFAFTVPAPGRYLVGTTIGDVMPAVHAAVQDAIAGAGVLARRVEVWPGATVPLHLPAPRALLGRLQGRVVGTTTATELIVDRVPADDCRRRRASRQPDGSFTVPALVPGDYEVRLVAADGTTVAHTTCHVDASCGGTAATVTLVVP
jgi:hypothetical protein